MAIKFVFPYVNFPNKNGKNNNGSKNINVNRITQVDPAAGFDYVKT